MEPDQAAFLLQMGLPQIDEEWEITKKVLLAVPDTALDYRPDPKARTAPELAWHIVSSQIWFLDGIVRGEFAMEEKEKPAHVDSIPEMAEWYELEAPPLMEQLRALPAGKLAEPVSFFGLHNYSAVTYLTFLLVHTVHHRAQLATYLRPMGGTVPSIYGGSADEPFEMPK